MQIVSMQNRSNGACKRAIIHISSGQYHFVDWKGWRIEWDTQTPREWWAKQQWLKAGGYIQEEK